jgi:hypothetical protein
VIGLTRYQASITGSEWFAGCVLLAGCCWPALAELAEPIMLVTMAVLEMVGRMKCSPHEESDAN